MLKYLALLGALIMRMVAKLHDGKNRDHARHLNHWSRNAGNYAGAGDYDDDRNQGNR